MKNDIVEIVKPIRGYKQSEDALISFLNKAETGIIYVGMKFLSLSDPEVKNAIIKCEVPTKRFILHDEESMNRINFLEEMGEVKQLSSNELDFSYLPSNLPPYWFEAIVSPNEFVCLYPHNPNKNRNYHNHIGIKIHGNNEIKRKVTKLCYTELEKFWEDIINNSSPHRFPALERFVNDYYLEINRQALKKHYGNKWIVISGGSKAEVFNDYSTLLSKVGLMEEVSPFADKLCVNL